jgi:hypothetical protein
MPVLVRYSLKVFRSLLAGLCLLFSNTLVAQYTKPEKTEYAQGTIEMVGVRSKLFSSASEGLVLPELGSTPWLTSVVNTEKRNPLSASIQKIKKEKTKRKSNTSFEVNELQSSSSTASPTLSSNFKGNVFNGGSPPDNTLAISTSGYIVSMINSNIAYYTTSGSLVWAGSFWELFKDPTLTEIIYDPIVLFDSQENRFVLIAIHGFTSATSKLLIGFSKTDNPADGWFTYKLSGNPLNNSCWLDYPKLGISNNEIFITGNLYGDLTGFSEAIIYQITKGDGYTGKSLTWNTWSNINGSPVNIIPASYGQKGNYGPGLYFVSQSPASGNAIDLFEITNEINKNPQLTRNQIFKRDYSTSGFAKQLGTSVELVSGDCRIMNAFYLNGIIHYVFQEDYENTNFTGINYNQLNVSARTNTSFTYGKVGFDYAYPSVASYGTTASDRAVAICFLNSGATLFPETRVVLFDNTQKWSNSTLLRKGDNFVDAFQFDNFVRWGDYSGICYRYNPSGPEVWVSGCYGSTQTLFNVNYNCFNAWIGQISETVLTDIDDDINKVSSLSVYPNPVIDFFTVEFDVPETSVVNIEITDLSGKNTHTLFQGTLKKGKNLLTFNKQAANRGINLVRIFSKNQPLLTTKMVVD